MKKILFITSQYRVGERIYPIIPYLSSIAELHLLKTYQMLDTHKWAGVIDLRNIFDKKYLPYFSKVFYNTCDVKSYDLIISDDNRNSLKTNLKQVYKNKTGLLLACTHGNTDDSYAHDGYKEVFDKCFVFGKYDSVGDYCIPAGIPSNDKLLEYQNLDKRHILVIVNFLGNRKHPYISSICKVQFDEKLFKDIDILSIQQYFNLPVIIKLKGRADEINYNNVDYVHNILPNGLNYQIIYDVEDDNKLIAQSAAVISAPSTLAFKSIQAGIPTVLINESGALGSFKYYDGLLNKEDNILSYLQSYSKKTHFIENSIAGGLNFNSTEIMFNEIKKFI